MVRRTSRRRVEGIVRAAEDCTDALTGANIRGSSMAASMLMDDGADAHLNYLRFLARLSSFSTSSIGASAEPAAALAMLWNAVLHIKRFYFGKLCHESIKVKAGSRLQKFHLKQDSKC